MFIGRIDGKAETPVLWPPHAKSWLIGKDSDAGRDWGQEEKGMTEDNMAGWHHWLDGCEFEWTPEVGDGQGGLVCCNSWGRKESDMIEWLNWTDWTYIHQKYFNICNVPSKSLVGRLSGSFNFKFKPLPTPWYKERPNIYKIIKEKTMVMKSCSWTKMLVWILDSSSK